jgi:hypothetical protein
MQVFVWCGGFIKPPRLVAIFLGLIFIVIISQNCFAQNKGITFQTVISNPASQKIVLNNSTVNLKILAPNLCVLRDEDFSGVSTSVGYINLTVGGGTVTANDPGFALSQIFSNAQTFTNPIASCTYAPSSSDARILRMTISDNGTPVVLDFSLRSMGYAFVADTVNGKSDTQLVNTSSNITQTHVESVFAHYSNLDKILTIGSSNQILGIDSAGNVPEYKTIVAGSGISISHAVNGITISSTSSGSVQSVTAASTSGNPISVAGSSSNPTVDLPKSSSTLSGYLSSTDWNTFNGKLSSSLADGRILVGNVGNVATSVVVSGDATLNNSGALVLASSGVTAGSYPKVTVDSKGRVTSGATLLAADIPGLDWSKIISGKPTTLAGYGIADGVQNLGNSPSLQSGLDSNKPVAGTLGRIYIASDSLKIYRDNGTSWEVVSSASGSGGTVSSVSGNLPISVASSTTTPVVSIANANTVTTGALTSADWNTFNNKLGSIANSAALANSKIWIGDGSNKAQEFSMSGDVAMTSGGLVTVGKIQNITVDSSAPSSAGQVLRYDGTTKYIAGFLSLADIRSTVIPGNTIFPNSTCTSGQTLTWSVLTDTLTCSNINISNITSGVLPVANGGTGTSSGSITGSSSLTFAAGGANQNVTLTPSGTGYTLLNGNVGIGTSAPAAKLDVSGEVKFGNTSSTCNATNEGQQRYNSTVKVMEFCNGVFWSIPGAPVGTVIAFAGNICPAGTVAANGAAVSRAGTYANLFSIIGITHGYGDNGTTFNLPDYRGRFLRGIDGIAGVDPESATRTAMNLGGVTGNNVGSIQSDSFASHSHSSYVNIAGGLVNASYTYPIINNIGQGTSSGLPTGGTETRPKNAYVNFCIYY